MKIINPPSWPTPKGYNNGVEAHGRILFIAGQIGWDKSSKIVSSSLVDQVRQALDNVKAVLSEAKGSPGNIGRMTWYVVDKKEYLEHSKEIGAVYRAVMGSHYPAMSLVEVKSLLEEGAKVEIEATAVLPD